MSRRVISRLRDHGHKAYSVGGCVRDSLLGRPAKDWDVATSALPDQVVALFPNARVVGKEYGVCAVPDGPQKFVEVATFRRDGGYGDGRRPDNVVFTDRPRQDVLRRDFTVNGILHDPIQDRYLDYVGGRDDLERRVIRTIGDPAQRFDEDRLRMLRAVRFAASLGFEIEPGTLAGIRAMARGVSAVASERIRDELNRILTEGGARRGFELLESSGLLAVVLPEVSKLRGVEQPPQFHPEGDVWTHTMIMLDGLESPSVPLAWGVLLHDIGKPDTMTVTDRIRFHGHVERGCRIVRRICGRLRFSKADTAEVVALVANHMRFIHLQQMRPGRLRNFLETNNIEDHLALHRLDCLSSHGSLENYEFAQEQRETWAQQESAAPVALLTGRDLKEAGYTPGPIFRRILDTVEDLQLDGELTDRDSALALVKERFPLESAD